jgi:chemotaxis protein methyltransferase CheR
MSQDTKIYVDFIRSFSGLDISVYDNLFLEKIIKSRMNDTSCKTDQEYLFYLSNVSGEPTELLRQLTNSYSEFFRNPLTFSYLEQVILPQLIEKKKIRNENEIRIWSAACASGQEAYSLAILCDELIENNNAKITCRIFATDNNPNELMDARKGDFYSAALGKVSLKRIQTYFTLKGETYTISPQLRDIIDFSVFDLLSDPGTCPPASVYGNFDLVFCSNLLFYYKPEFRNSILEKTGNSLAKGGFIITGETEREIVMGNNYREVFVHSAIFQKR